MFNQGKNGKIGRKQQGKKSPEIGKKAYLNVAKLQKGKESQKGERKWCVYSKIPIGKGRLRGC